MTYRVVFRRSATEDLDEAVSWYDAQRQGLGTEFLSEIEAAIDRVAADPERFPIARDDVRRAVARRFPFSVYFRIRARAREVVVLAVFHARRDPRIWQRRT